MNDPSEIKWIEGELPDVHTVPYDCKYLVWKVFHNAEKSVEIGDTCSYKFVPAPELEGELKRIGMAYPWKDDLNPLRWCDPYPIGFQEKVKYYAVIYSGNK